MLVLIACFRHGDNGTMQIGINKKRADKIVLLSPMLHKRVLCAHGSYNHTVLVTGIYY